MSGGQDFDAHDLVIGLNDAQEFVRDHTVEVLVSRKEAEYTREGCADMVIRALAIAAHNKFDLGDSVAERLRRLT